MGRTNWLGGQRGERQVELPQRIGPTGRPKAVPSRSPPAKGRDWRSQPYGKAQIHYIVRDTLTARKMQMVAQTGGDRVSAVRDEPVDQAAKRLFDVSVAIFGLVSTAPLLVTLAALIRIDSPGPALFFQARVGQGRRVFTMVKLRTMAGGRVTRIGRLLRPTGLDELPQLWHVITGEMSLVGPRPEVPDRVARYERELVAYQQRHAIRPGITGLAQINGLRGDVSIAARLHLDLDYVRRWSLRLDACILAATVPTVVVDTVRSILR